MARSFLLLLLGPDFGDVADDHKGTNDHVHDDLNETVMTLA